MYVRRKRGWDIPERLATPEAIFLNRRQLIAAGAVMVAGSMLPPRALAQGDPSAGLYPAPRNGRYAIDRPVTPEAINVHHNNFYEFGMYKDIAAAADALPIRPWDIRVDGLVENEFTLGIDDLLRRVTLEERLYRHRAVEGWSMTVPWTGFPLAALVAIAKPLGSARYLRMESFLNPDVASGQNSFYAWPYVEGLTMAEATNELAFVVTGAYGRPVANAMGAPIRVHLPWKYGFKSVKSIVRFRFTDEQPLSFWQQLSTSEYGFWANVNPDVAHPRWSQKTEHDIGTGETVPTRIFNGYGEIVAGLYSGLGGEALFM
jgi:sulfoxide reductase catalytic subunit YedY